MFVEQRELGKLYRLRVAFRLNNANAPEPDIAFVAKARLDAVKRGAVEGPPDLAVEIISPDSVERDYHKKRELYRKAGVREYWILDEPQEKTLFLRLDSRGAYREVKLKDGVFSSQVVPGFWLKTAWLWQKPLPKVLTALREILGAG
jgi:Uma2 family endonuclease